MCGQPIFHWFSYDTSCVDEPIVHWFSLRQQLCRTTDSPSGFSYGKNCVDQRIVHWFPYGRNCVDQPIVHWFPYDNSCVDQLIVHQFFPMANVAWINRLSIMFSLRQQLCRPTIVHWFYLSQHLCGSTDCPLGFLHKFPNAPRIVLG